MNKFFALWRRESAALFLSPALHLAAALFVLLYGLAFYLNVAQEQKATLDAIALFVFFLSAFLAPLITMRSFAGERAQGTIEILLTAPLRPAAIVLAKFAAAWLFYLITLLPCLGQAFMLSAMASLDWPATMMALLGLALAGGAYLGVGLLASSLTDSQFVAAGAGCGALLVMFMLASFADQPGARAVAYLSPLPHFQTAFLRGILDTRAIVYFLSLGACSLFLTWLTVAHRELWPQRPTHRGWAFAAGALFLGAGEALLAGAALINIYGWKYSDLRAAFAARESAAIIAAAALSAAPALAVASWLCLRRSREPLSGIWQRWREQRAAAVPIAALAAIVIALNFNYQASLFWRRWDLSAAGVNSLSLDTRLVLQEISDRVDIRVFYSDKIDYQGVPLLRRVRELLDEYRNHSAYICPHYADAVLEPEEAARAAAEMGLDLGQMPQVAVMEYRGRRRLVPSYALLKQPDVAQRLAGIRAASFHGELAFTLALKQMLDPRVVRIYAATGHGELAVSGTEEQPRSMGKWMQALRHDGFDVQPLLLKGQDIPADSGVLLLAGPRLPLGREICDAIRRYLDGGGRLLLLLPSAKLAGAASERAEDADLLDLAAACGARVEANAIFDTRNNDNGIASAILAVTPEGGDLAPIGRQAVCVFPYARSLRENLAAERDGWLIERLLTSCETAVARTKVDPGEIARSGPHVLAVAAARPAAAGRPEARAVIVGNADFVSNIFVDRMHNREWALGLVHWLAGRDYQLRIPPPNHPDYTFCLSGASQRLVFWVSVVGMPQIWLLLAALVWWARRE